MMIMVTMGITITKCILVTYANNLVRKIFTTPETQVHLLLCQVIRLTFLEKDMIMFLIKIPRVIITTQRATTIIIIMQIGRAEAMVKVIVMVVIKLKLE